MSPAGLFPKGRNEARGVRGKDDGIHDTGERDQFASGGSAGLARTAPRGRARARTADRRSASSPDRPAGERALPAAGPAGRHRQRTQRRRHRLSRMALDVSRRRAGRDAPGRRDRVRQRRRGDVCQRQLRQAARLCRHRRPRRPHAGRARGQGAGGDDRGGRRPVPRHSLHPGQRSRTGPVGRHARPAGRMAARYAGARRLRATGAARAQLRCLHVPSQLGDLRRPGARLSGDADRPQPCRRRDRAGPLQGQARRRLCRLERAHPRAGGVPQRAREARWPRHEGVRVRRARGRAAAELRAARDGMAALYRDLHRGLRSQPRDVRKQLPVDKGSYGYGVFWNACKRLAQGASASEKADLFHGTASRFYRLGI